MKQENEKAKIIAFCGIDGSGKSTQLKLVRDYLSKDAKVLVAKMSYSPLNRMGDNKIFDLALKGYSGLRIISYYYPKNWNQYTSKGKAGGYAVVTILLFTVGYSCPLSKVTFAALPQKVNSSH